MRDWKPKTLWDELVRTVHGWIEREDEEGEQAQDPSWLFHLLFTAPLLLGLYAMARHS